MPRPGRLLRTRAAAATVAGRPESEQRQKDGSERRLENGSRAAARGGAAAGQVSWELVPSNCCRESAEDGGADPPIVPLEWDRSCCLGPRAFCDHYVMATSRLVAVSTSSSFSS